MEGYEELYSLVERLQRISNELSDTAHELEEHLAWD